MSQEVFPLLNIVINLHQRSVELICDSIMAAMMVYCIAWSTMTRIYFIHDGVSV